MTNYILQQSLAPLLRDHFHADTEKMFGIAYTVMMAAGRHHSAWTKGWENKDIRKVRNIELHPEARCAIASSWRCLVHFLPTTLPTLPEPKLSKNIYPVTTNFKLNKLGIISSYPPPSPNSTSLHSRFLMRLCELGWRR
ncbi:MAG: hypothetical protein DSM106950_02905 [Stigonema ocellatum SAG 48.90 = DSM 106950]|nr:hypothetical protein [Stigonema ocellatum SAG 48.90 = DSM 106950]